MGKRQHSERTEALAPVVDQRIAAAANQSATAAAIQLGAIGGIKRLADRLNAEIIKALSQIRDHKTYTHFTDGDGKPFGRFDDFCDFCEHSPMPYNKFYEQERLLEAEGEQVFNLLGQTNLPTYLRKKLPPGAIRVDADAIVIADETGEETRIARDDLDALTQTLKELARANSEKEKLIAQGRKQLEQLQVRAQSAEGAKYDLEAKIEKLQVGMEAGYALPKELPPLEAGLGQVLGAFAKLRETLKAASPAQRDAFASLYVSQVDLANDRCLCELGLITPEDLLQSEISSNQRAAETFDDLEGE
jgi:hypothetical protein